MFVVIAYGNFQARFLTPSQRNSSDTDGVNMDFEISNGATPVLGEVSLFTEFGYNFRKEPEFHAWMN